jgi:hypothetical protein
MQARRIKHVETGGDHMLAQTAGQRYAHAISYRLLNPRRPL